MTKEDQDKLLRWMVDAKVMFCQVRHHGRFYIAELTDRGPEDAGVYHYDISVKQVPGPIELAF